VTCCHSLAFGVSDESSTSTITDVATAKRPPQPLACKRSTATATLQVCRIECVGDASGALLPSVSGANIPRLCFPAWMMWSLTEMVWSMSQSMSQVCLRAALMPTVKLSHVL
jgi:hypothetical protein